MFGTGGRTGDPRTLFFTDGINGETDGLFGALTVPEPSTWAMMLIGFGGLRAMGRAAAAGVPGRRLRERSQEPPEIGRFSF